MPQEMNSMEQTSAGDKLKLALVGYEQNGKSWLAATARKPVLFHEFDRKKESLAGKSGVYVISYHDDPWPKQPDAAQLFLDNIAKLESSLDLSDLGLPCPKGTICRTQVVDSIQNLAKCCNNYALYNTKDIRREITVGNQKLFFNKGWDAVNSETTMVENDILRLLALPTDTIIILHETEEQSADSTPEHKKFTGRADVYPPRYRMLLKYFPNVWQVKLTQVMDTNKSVYLPRVYPKPNYEFDSGTTLLLDEIENPNIEEILRKHSQKALTAGSPATKTLQAAKI